MRKETSASIVIRFKNRFSHSRLTEEEVIKFIEQNEEFLSEVHKSIGRTNMDEFYYHYISEKKKQMANKEIEDNAAKSVMIPQIMAQIGGNSSNSASKNILYLEANGNNNFNSNGRGYFAF